MKIIKLHEKYTTELWHEREGKIVCAGRMSRYSGYTQVKWIHQAVERRSYDLLYVIDTQCLCHIYCELTKLEVESVPSQM